MEFGKKRGANDGAFSFGYNFRLYLFISRCVMYLYLVGSGPQTKPLFGCCSSGVSPWPQKDPASKSCCFERTMLLLPAG